MLLIHCVILSHQGLTVGFLLLQYSVPIHEMLRPYLCFVSISYFDKYVAGDDASSIDKLGIFHANQTSMCLNPQ